MSEINVAIADDNERILDLLGEIVESDHELRLVGRANNGEDAGRGPAGSDYAEDGWLKRYGDGEPGSGA